MGNNPIYLNKVITTGKPPAINRGKERISNNNATTNTQFNDILQKKLQENKEVKFSKHASLRMETRNIKLDSKDLERINDGVKKAEEKGVNDSLILMDQNAFVVSVRNKTVITAVNKEELKNNVFTNIDGAVIV